MSHRTAHGASRVLCACLALTGSIASAPTPPADCPSPEAVTPAHLYGRWRLTLGAPEKPVGTGVVELERHPEYADRVRGSFERETNTGHYKALVAGDVAPPGFQMEESVDGITIDAVWSGDVLPASCGREIQGWRRVVEGHTSPQEPESETPFTLQKALGWQ